MAEEGFTEYMTRSRQVLDEAFRATLCDLIDTTLIGMAHSSCRHWATGKRLEGV